MRKFFFRSAGNSKNNLVPPLKNETQAYGEHPLESRMNNSVDDKAGCSPHSIKDTSCNTEQQGNDIERSSTSPKLRRTRSMSSAAFSSGGGQMNFYSSNDPSGSPLNVPSASKQQLERSACCQSLTPERLYKVKQMEKPSNHYMPGSEKPCSVASSSTFLDSSGNSSTSSSNVSNRVLDRYIDGEQQQQISASKLKFSQRNNGWRPPRAQCQEPSSPTASIKDKPRFHSFREAKSSHSHLSHGEWGEYGFGNESPRSIAKNVVDRLSQCHVVPKVTSKELCSDVPITITDIYNRSLNGSRCFDHDSDVVNQTCFPVDEPCETVNNCHPEDLSGFHKHKFSPGYISEGCKFGETDECLEGELERRAKEAEERVMFLSQELEHEHFVQYRKFDVSELIHIIKNLTDDRFALALENSRLLQSQMAERASFKEDLRLANAELDSSIRKLEKEKSELQLGLEKELDRRSNDWSLKLEKHQLEEHRLRERVRELAEQNVSLQREVSSFNERETENSCTINNLEQNMLDLTTRIEQKGEHNKYLQLELSKLEDEYRAAVEGRDCFKKNFEEKDKECRELHKSITRLSRTCSEQEKTIDGLRETFSEQLGKIQTVEKFDKQFENMKMEQIRLAGVELALRRELESCRVEVDSLRHENINILTRLKDNRKESVVMTFNLDNEMCSRIYYLQNQGLVLLNESIQFCSKLLEFIKERAFMLQETKQGMEHIKKRLDEQFVVDSEMEIQSFKHRIESLTMSLQKISMLLHEKSNLTSLEIHSQSSDENRALQLNNQYSEVDILRSELKAEALLTSLLREKIYSKELEVEQLQAELVAAIRGNDILKCEVQNGMDNLSSVTHKLKNLELQLLKKNEDISKLQNGMEESTKELETLRDILPKISQERDMVWEEVNRNREKNMLLNSEVDVLKTKIETLEEDVLVKEGQISILKDALGSKSVDLLASPGSTWPYRL